MNEFDAKKNGQMFIQKDLKEFGKPPGADRAKTELDNKLKVVFFFTKQKLV